MIWRQDRDQLLRRAMPDVSGTSLPRAGLPPRRYLTGAVVNVEGDGGNVLFIHRGPHLSDASHCARERHAIVRSSAF